MLNDDVFAVVRVPRNGIDMANDAVIDTHHRINGTTSSVSSRWPNIDAFMKPLINGGPFDNRWCANESVLATLPRLVGSPLKGAVNIHVVVTAALKDIWIGGRQRKVERDIDLSFRLGLKLTVGWGFFAAATELCFMPTTGLRFAPITNLGFGLVDGAAREE